VGGSFVCLFAFFVVEIYRRESNKISKFFLFLKVRKEAIIFLKQKQKIFFMYD
jgi:hypothetical protein